MPSSKIRLTEQQRSAARRAAGRRIERKHPFLLRELRQYYNQERFKELWGSHFNARRTEQVRSEIIAKFPEEYSEILKEEENNVRTKS